MLLNPYEPDEEIEYDYALIDLNLNSNYFDDVSDKLISLSPNYVDKVKKSFPYLLKMNQISKELLREIYEYDRAQIEQGLNPFCIFIFKSIPTREPDIIDHLKKMLIYSEGGKKYLYRFYDPKVWILLNYFESKGFLYINSYFKNVNFGLLKNRKIFYFENLKNESSSFFDFKVDLKLIENISICNNVLELLDKEYEFNSFLYEVEKIFLYINFSKNNQINEKKDIVAFVFHTLILGDQYINTDLFNYLKNSNKGYEQQSKRLSTEDWNTFLDKFNFFDKELRSKVIYDY